MTKKQAIEQSILTIAEYFEINPKALADQRTTRGVRTQNAMAAFVYHLHACGMSYDRIGKFICKQDCRVRRYVSQGAMMMRGEHKRMIESLPKIPTTIEIVKNATAQTPPDSGTKTMDKPQAPEAAETVQTTNVPAVDLPRLVGLLVFAGDLEVNGEEISGCAVDIDRATLIAAKSLPMYERCVIVTAAELQKMEAVIEAAKCIRHWHDREPDGMIVSAEHVRKLWAALHDLEANAKSEP